MKNRKRAAVLLILTVCMVLAGGCGRNAKNAGKQTEKEGKIQIVCTTFPQYDWVREVLGAQSEKCRLTLLMDGGTDLHNYQPTVQDMAEISSCDLFIYVGGESDRWVEDALKNPVNPDRRVLNMMEILKDSIKEEEIVEGMEDAGEETDAAQHGTVGQSGKASPQAEEENGHSETEYDEHVWLSLKNAKVMVEHISQTICEIDGDAAKEYQEHAESYVQKLDTLDVAYETVVENAKKHTVLFGDRFPFRYLTEDYGLAYYAAFAGCSAETEASFATITFLAEKADELEVPVVLTIENSDKKVAEAIVRNTKSRKQQILQMNSLQSVSTADLEAGETYLSVMEENLEVLKAALG